MMRHLRGLSQRHRRLKTRPSIERFERRITPATATLVSGVLTINYTATGVTAESVTVTNNGINVVLTGNISGATSSSVASVTKIDVQDSGQSNNQSLTLAGTSTFSLSNGFSSMGAETVKVNNGVNVTGLSTLSITSPKTIIVTANLTTDSGNLTLSANQQVVASNGNFKGIDVNGATIGSTSGNVTLQGRGGDSTIGGQFGVYLHGSAKVGGGTNGIVNVAGTGGSSLGPGNIGVTIDGCSLTGGSVSITGLGDGISGAISPTASNHGLLVIKATISNIGVGSVSLQGTAGVADWGGSGCNIDELTINNNTGTVTIVGVGGGEELETPPPGVYTQGNVDLTGTGPLNVSGTGPPTGHGIFIGFGSLTTGGGSISLIGQGGSLYSISGEDRFGTNGVAVLGSVVAGGNGNVSIQGSSPSTFSGNGVYVRGTITSSGGAVTVIGQGAAGFTDSCGVAVVDGLITAGGNGEVTVKGTGGGVTGGVGNYGVAVLCIEDAPEITSSGGKVTVEAIGGKGQSAALCLGTLGTISSGGNADLTIIADSILCERVSLIRGASDGKGKVFIRPRTAGTRINLGGMDALSSSTLALGLSQVDLNAITAGELIIGADGSSYPGAATGPITVSSAIQITGHSKVTIATADSITVHNHWTNGGGELTLRANQGIGLTAPLGNSGGALNLIADSDGDNKGAVSLALADVNRWVAQSSLNSSNGGQYDDFGYAVAISADGNTMVVGAPNAASQYGEAYVFTRVAGVWTEQAILPSAGNYFDAFGAAVAISGDGNTAIIGAPGRDVGLNFDQGAAFIYRRVGSIWTLQAEISASGNQYDEFGIAVALNGDGNTVVVGAPGHAVGANVDQGTAYVYQFNGGVWSQQAVLISTGGGATESFGLSVSISSDGNTVAAGAPRYEIGANLSQGVAYVYRRSGTVWSQQAQLLAIDGDEDDAFGRSLALSGDASTVVVGSHGHDIGANADRGASYVFSFNGVSWPQQAKLIVTDDVEWRRFGIMLAISADGNTVLGGVEEGGVSYCFRRAGAIWTQQQSVTTSDADSDLVVGLALSSDGTTAVLGCPDYFDLTTFKEGIVYAFRIDVSPGSLTNAGSSNIHATGAGFSLAGGALTAGGSITLNSTLAISQSLGIILAPTGTLLLNASGQTATFASTGNKAGALVISSGVTALVNGSFDSTGAVQVDGTLGGKGSVGTVTVTSTGKINPGASPGKLSTGNIALNSGSKFSVELNGAVASTDYDQLVVNGTVNLGGATLTGSVGFTPSIGQVFTIIDNDGILDAVTGTFNGIIEGGTATLGAHNFKVSYNGGDGNDVTLTRLAPPTVSSVTFGDGTNQRSLVKQIVVTFSEAVSFTPSVASAFTVHRSGTGGSIGDVSITTNPATGPASSVTISFSGVLTEFGSLVDGLYDFTIDASKVSGAGGALDGNLDTIPGGNYAVSGTTANKFFRYFGDFDGDGALAQSPDFIEFRNAFGPPSTIFDFDNDNSVDQDDFIKFRNNFGGGP